LNFKAGVSWDGFEGGKSLIGKKIVYRFDTPKEFGGKAVYSSPEQIFVSSFGACFITTFLYFRKKSPFSMKSLKVDAKGKLEHNDGKGYRITQINASVIVEIEDTESVEKVQKCYSLTEKFCPISQTLKNCILIKLSLKINKL
jgi:organic hydroperoxide reductase OsmC/OhrA